MTEPNNLVLQHLRAIREVLDAHTDRLLEITQRLGIWRFKSPIYRFGLIASMLASIGSSAASA